MTKFEEKLERLPIKTIQHPVGDTKYYTAVHVKTLIAQADEEIANLKSQLQQQALPVVPEFVAKWHEEHKDDLESSIYRLCIEFNQKVVNTLKTKTKLENWLDYTENKPIETLIRMQEGYTVEKSHSAHTDKLSVEKLQEQLNTAKKALTESEKMYQKQMDRFLNSEMNESARSHCESQLKLLFPAHKAYEALAAIGRDDE
ncbi:DUF1642 domain-containing protein [Lactococcus lactis]|uniref:DUF1642 domain-containing protein n=1 Tax=Lactococcus lactis TaxID=1358 RepID=UPI002FE4C086